MKAGLRYATGNGVFFIYSNQSRFLSAQSVIPPAIEVMVLKRPYTPGDRHRDRKFLICAGE